MEVSGRRADEDEGVATGLKDKLCEPCRDEHVKTHAKGLCRECKEFMCNTCFRHHLKARQCRNHALVDASQSLDRGSETFEKCAHHENEAIKYYCRTHEIVGCGDCMVLGHGACKPEFIKDLSKNFQENEGFKNLVRKLETMTSANKEIGEAIQNSHKKIGKVYDKALGEISKFRTDINTFLDKAEADVKAELHRLKSDNENLLAELDEEWGLLSSNMDKVKQNINAEIYHGNSLFIHTVEMTPEVLNIERALARAQSEDHMINIEFIPDKQLLNIVASGIKLGHIQNKVDQTGGTEKDLEKKKDVVFVGANSSPKQECANSKKDLKVTDSCVEQDRALMTALERHRHQLQKEREKLQEVERKREIRGKCCYGKGGSYTVDEKCMQERDRLAQLRSVIDQHHRDTEKMKAEVGRERRRRQQDYALGKLMANFEDGL